VKVRLADRGATTKSSPHGDRHGTLVFARTQAPRKLGLAPAAVTVIARRAVAVELPGEHPYLRLGQVITVGLDRADDWCHQVTVRSLPLASCGTILVGALFVASVG